MSTVVERQKHAGYSRRGFLRRAGAGGGTVALSGGLGAAFAPRAVAARSATVTTSPTTFGRMFPESAGGCARDGRGPCCARGHGQARRTPPQTTISGKDRCC